MPKALTGLHPVLLALLATLFTWGMTALGAATVFTAKTIHRKTLDGLLGFAAGVMIAASYWSLLEPALEMAEGGPLPAWLPAAIGFLLGGLFLWGIDKLLPHLHPLAEVEGVKPGSGVSFDAGHLTTSLRVWQWVLLCRASGLPPPLGRRHRSSHW